MVPLGTSGPTCGCFSTLSSMTPWDTLKLPSNSRTWLGPGFFNSQLKSTRDPPPNRGNTEMYPSYPAVHWDKMVASESGRGYNPYGHRCKCDCGITSDLL